MLNLLQSPATGQTELTWRTVLPTRDGDWRHDWKQLEQRIGSSRVACSATWMTTWLECYGDLVPQEIHIAESAGTIRGMALVTRGVGQKLGPFSIRTRHLGTAGEPQLGSVCVEYNCPLVESGFEVSFLEGLSQRLNSAADWEQFRVDGIAEDDVPHWLALWPAAEVRRRSSRYFDLAEARDAGRDVISSLGKSTRSNLRRRFRQYGELSTEWAEDASTAADILAELIDLHQARWQSVGEPGAFANPRFRRFQEECALRLFLEERAVLYRVRQGQETIGCLYLLVDQNRLLDYLSGFADFREKPSPGLTTHALCLQQALTRGYDAYDFLVGDKRHKENLSTHENHLCWLTCSRPSWKKHAYRTLRKVKAGYRDLRNRLTGRTADRGSASSSNSTGSTEES